MKLLHFKQYYPAFFILMFFLPYVGGRGRVEVAVAYILLLFILFKKIRMLPYEKNIFFIFSLYSLWTLIIILLNYTGDVFRTLIVFTNENMLFLGMIIFLFFKDVLVKNTKKILLIFLYFSILVNLIAIFQFLSPDHVINSKIFSLYGGTLSAGYAGIGGMSIGSNAEFLVRVAHRMTSIFTGMQFLAVYNLIVFVFAVIYLNMFKRVNSFVFITIIGLSFIGGILSVSKSYYAGILILLLISLIALFSRKKINKKRIKKLMFILFILFVLILFYIPDILHFLSENQVISSFVQKVFSFDTSAMLGSRYSETGHLTETINMIFQDLNLFFFGVGADLQKYVFGDSLYISRILVSGTIGLVLFLLGLWTLNKWNYKIFKNINGVLLIILHIDLLIIGLGIPTYSMARLTMLLIILNLMVLNYEYRYKHSKEKHD